MIITISVVATCVILVGINIYVVIKDYFDKQNTLSWVRRRLKRMSDDLFYMDQDIAVMKKNIETLRIDIVRLTSNPKDIVDIDGIDARIASLENKTELALMSVQTIQNNFLQNLDEK